MAKSALIYCQISCQFNVINLTMYVSGDYRGETDVIMKVTRWDRIGSR